MNDDVNEPYLYLKNKTSCMSSMNVQVEHALSILSKNEVFVKVLEYLRENRIPNSFIGGGCVPQIVWNHFHGFEANQGIDDFDVVYFDSSDLSGEREKETQDALEKFFPACPVRLEAVNEARTHVWYAQDFGRHIAPYTCTEDAIYCFPTTASSVGVRFSQTGALEIFAPHGLTDLLGLVMRPNKVQITRKRFEEKVERWREIWPKISVIPWSDE